ncbi:MAG TPA: nucleotide exchange factor GrpE [Candidatus Paceibacterota bacterium]
MDDLNDPKKTKMPDIDTPIDDVEIESYNDDAGSDGEMTPEDRIKRLKEKLRERTREKAANLDGWQRTKADFVNYRKREEEGKAGFLKFAGEQVVTDLLPVLESFHMAFANKEAWEKVDQSWRSGVEYIHTQLVQILREHGLSEVNPIGQDFDPNEHMSVGTVVTEDKKSYHKVAQVLQLGYRLNGKLIRSPRVKIYGEHSDATSEPKPG